MPPARRILALSPMPPEPTAYALARYSRSPDGIEDSLRWIAARDQSSARFLDTFYFAYGHASIADNGPIVHAIEHISELAAIAIQDEPLWNGQAKSTRYQKLSREACYYPEELNAHPTLHAAYAHVLTQLFSVYEALHPKICDYLSQRHPRPVSMPEAEYQRTINARAFDSVRYFLPLATLTNVGQLLTIRTLERQIARLGAHPLPELRAIATELKQRCAEPPTGIWQDVTGQPLPTAPLAPTLARHCDPNPYAQHSHAELTACAQTFLADIAPDTSETVRLIPAHDPFHELVTTLLYPVTHLSYRQILEQVQDWPEARGREVIALATKHRGKHDELLPEFQIGQGLTVDVLMDIGGWRDLHRHRRWVQTRQAFTTHYGIAIPPLVTEAGLLDDYTACLWATSGEIYGIQSAMRSAGLPDLSIYLIPFGFRCRSLYKASLRQLDYVIRLRSGIKGHPSYRRVAWELYQQLCQAYPFMRSILSATPPEIEDPLIR